MKITSWRIAVLVCSIAAFLPNPAQSAALLATSLDGTYGFRFAATIVPRSDAVATVSAPAPFAASGVFTADGTGTITAGSITYNYNGIVCSTTITAGSRLTGSVYTVEPDGETAILLVLPTDSGTCGVTSLFLSAALDDIGPGRVARHVQLANTAVVAIRLGTTAFSAPTDIAVVGAGEARFQEPTAVRPLPCLIFNRC
jgi:hypothetical protein